MKSNKIILTEKCIVCYTFQLQSICHMRWAFKLNWKPIYLVAWHYMTHCIHKICNFVQFHYFSIIFSIKFIRYSISIAHTNSNRSIEWKNEIINFSIWNWVITIFYELLNFSSVLLSYLHFKCLQSNVAMNFKVWALKTTELIAFPCNIQCQQIKFLLSFKNLLMFALFS